MNDVFLLHTPIFRNFEEASLAEALQALRSRRISYQKGEIIFQEGDLTDELGIVLSGDVHVERIDYMGNRNILSHIGPNQIFAESYALLPQEPMMIDVVAGSDCEILFLNIQRAGTPDIQKYAWYPTLILNLLHISNRKNLELSKRNFHTFSKTIRGRVLSYLVAQSRQQGKKEFEIPFNRQQMADYLNLDRSALSNELSKMRAEGLIDFWKNHFRLKV